MRQPFYRKATVQAAAVTGVFALIATVVGTSITGNFGCGVPWVGMSGNELQVQVFDYRNIGQYCKSRSIGEAYSEFILDALVQHQLGAEPADSLTHNLEYIFLYYDGPPMEYIPPDPPKGRNWNAVAVRGSSESTPEDLEWLLRLAPVVALYGWVEYDEKFERFGIRSRVSLITTGWGSLKNLSFSEQQVPVDSLQVYAERFTQDLVDSVLTRAVELEAASRESDRFWNFDW